MDKISSIDVDTTDDLELVRHIYETRKIHRLIIIGFGHAGQTYLMPHKI